MFDRIAPVYDLMNRAMTLGLDRSWRRLAARAVVRRGDRVLDACCGTGDLAIDVARRHAGAEIIGVDPSRKMIDVGRGKLVVELYEAGTQSLVDVAKTDITITP
jgi:demethylmenaquinone methyltransferase/2-methoxy-6-polyprenyl-1,4-benzoquinol methylase